jgi:predicted lipoprotein with Yx(FWY)xxD motif
MRRATRALAGAIIGCLLAATAATAASTSLVHTVRNARLGSTILVDRHGRTLYDLSVERHGRFICDTKACLAFWTPLVVAKGTKPTGTVPLGTVKRPDGSIQVTFHGAPLYTFVEDRKAGDAHGEGFKDVGTWHAAALGGAAAATSAPAGGYTYP